tara:strand:+ start:2522 stop:2791 length:270 start_codon:yes stop_codon:yes gene_type:complete
MKCCICNGEIEKKKDPTTGKVYWDGGENAQPVKDGRCCETCNWGVVIPARMANMQRSRETAQEEAERKCGGCGEMRISCTCDSLKWGGD